MSAPRILKIAIDTPVDRLFDYTAPAAWPAGCLLPGVRVRVPFGRRKTVGMLMQVATTSEVASDKLRDALEVLDTQPVIDSSMLALLRWAAGYYRHPPGEVVAAALPVALRQGRDAELRVPHWHATAAGCEADLTLLAKRAPRQATLLALMRRPAGASRDELASTGDGWQPVASALQKKELAQRTLKTPALLQPSVATTPGPELNDHQRQAVDAIRAAGGGYQAILLHGITGSGKTEVYLHAIEEQIAAGRQSLVLVPEIGLTPQVVRRFSARLGVPLALLHSGLPEGERLAAWRAARSGDSPVVVGTRSAVFAPLRTPGLIIVDEEHDASFKQHEGFRYSARDLAVMRARQLSVPVVLGTATPSLESLDNVARGRYQRCSLPERPGAAMPPTVHLVDLNAGPVEHGISAVLARAIRRHLDTGSQVLLFLNRRGYAPAWFCRNCGWCARCQRCDARMTFHHGANHLRCHHCDGQRRPEEFCPDCAGELLPVGQGTERIEDYLNQRFADVPVLRIDRDSTRTRGQLEKALDSVRDNRPRILVGTQMLTKGHHFPAVTLVGVISADQGLFGTDFRSNERLAQLIVQVAGRAGRAERPGEVLVQTSCPQHPLLTRLLSEGYDGFAAAALEERRESRWPPYSSLALLRASATSESLPLTFLTAARVAAGRIAAPQVEVLGPADAVMHRRAGRFRARLLVQSDSRTALHRFLDGWAPLLGSLDGARKVRWSLDIDPQDLQ